MDREIVAGDSNMAKGGRYGSNNQESVLVVEKRAFHQEYSNEKDPKFKRRMDEVFYIIKDGDIQMPPKNDKNLLMGCRKDIRIKDHEKVSFFNKLKGASTPDVEVLGINPNTFSVTSPITVRLSTAELVDGTCTVDFQCDLRSEDSINSLSSLINDDFADHIKGLEEIWIMTESGMEKKLRGYISDCGLETLPEFASTYDVQKRLKSALFDNLRTDVAFSNKGLVVRRSVARFDAGSTEKIMQMKAEGKIQLAEDQIRHERNMTLIEFTDEENDLVDDE